MEPSDRARSANGTGIGRSLFASLPHFPSNLTGFIGERCPVDRGLDRPTDGLPAHTSSTQSQLISLQMEQNSGPAVQRALISESVTCESVATPTSFAVVPIGCR